MDGPAQSLFYLKLKLISLKSIVINTVNVDNRSIPISDVFAQQKIQ